MGDKVIATKRSLGKFLGLYPSLEEIDEDGKTYYVKSVNEFYKKLQAHEIETSTKFVLRKSVKKFHERAQLHENLHLRWKGDVPYFHFGTRMYTCHHGRDGNISQKKKYAQKRDLKETKYQIFTKRYNRAQLTKKLDCPAVIYVSRIIRIPEYKLNGFLTKKFEKRKASAIIKKKIFKNELMGEECFMFNLPDVGDHKYHFVGASVEVNEPIDARVRRFIKNQYVKGERDALVIAKLLENYVEKELKITDRQRRRFYPDMKTLRTITYRVKAKLAKGKTDGKSSKQVSKQSDSEVDEPASSHINQDILLEYQSNNKEYQMNSTSSFSRQDESHNEDASPIDVFEITKKQFETLNSTENSKKYHLNSCKTAIRSIESAMWFLDDDSLETLTITLEHLFLEMSSEGTDLSI